MSQTDLNQAPLVSPEVMARPSPRAVVKVLNSSPAEAAKKAPRDQFKKKPKKAFAKILHRCGDTDVAHRMFDPDNKDEPRNSIGSICPHCSVSLREWSMAIYPMAVRMAA